MKMSEKILRLRKQNGMSQEELAEKLGVSRQAVSRWEADLAQPDASNVFQLSRLFGVTADDLLNDEAGMPEKRSEPSALGKRRIAALCTAGIGLLGNAALYLASRFIEVMIPYVYEQDGTTWYRWSADHTGYSYKYFIEAHDLECVTTVLWALFVVGLIAALMDRKRIEALHCAVQKGIAGLKSRFRRKT